MINWNTDDAGNLSNHKRDQPILIDDNPFIDFVPGKLYLLSSCAHYHHLIQHSTKDNREKPCLLSRSKRKYIIGLDIPNLGMFMNYTFIIHEDYTGSMVAPVIQAPVFSIKNTLYVPDLTCSALYASQNVKYYLKETKPFVHNPNPHAPPEGLIFTLDDCIKEVEEETQ